MDNSRLADECVDLRKDLYAAAEAKQTIRINGRDYPAKLVNDILKMYVEISCKQGMRLTALKDIKDEYKLLREVNKELLDVIAELKAKT